MSPDQEVAVAHIMRLAAQKLSTDYNIAYNDCLLLCWEWFHASDKRQAKVCEWVNKGRQKQAMYYVIDGLKPRQKRGNRDQFNYSESLVDSLLPMAMDSTWAPEDDTVPDNDPGGKKGKRPPGEWGNQLALVMDVRRALKAGCASVVEITDWLNGVTR